MTKQINIKFLSDKALITLGKNQASFQKLIYENEDNTWFYSFADERPFIEKNFKISEFKLKTSNRNEYKDVRLENSITLYETFKDLPMYIVTDERFWLWVNFEMAYNAAKQVMEVKKSVFKNHWLFTSGKRRGLFFGILSRDFFTVMLTVDNKRKDKYELTRFALEDTERIRNLFWRTFSSIDGLVKEVISAEYEFFRDNGQIPNSIYPKIAKDISKIGSVKLLDSVNLDFINKFAKERIKHYLR
jgi:hypothetical protein